MNQHHIFNLPTLLELKNPHLDQAAAHVTTVLSKPNTGCETLVTIGYIHESCLNQTDDLISRLHPNLNQILDILDLFGDVFIELIRHHIAFLYTEAVVCKEKDNYRQRISIPLMNEVIDILQVSVYMYVKQNDIKNLKDNRTFSSITRRIIGGIALTYGYKTVFDLFFNTLHSKDIHIPAIASYQTALLEYSQRPGIGRAEYTTLNVTGPDHNRLFTVQVFTKDGKVAEGQNRSTGEAKENAAKAYLERYAPKYIEQISQTRKSAPIFLHSIPDQHLRSLKVLARNLGIPDQGLTTLSQALIHRSYQHELKSSKGSNCQENSMLAQLGSQVFRTVNLIILLPSILKYQQLTTGEFRNLRTLVSTVETPQSIAEVYELLQLNKFLLVGRGHQPKPEITIQADAVQSVFATYFIGQDLFIDSPEKYLPKHILTYFGAKFNNSLETETQNTEHSKQRLQEILQDIGLEFKYYSVISGPSHLPVYRATLEIINPVTHNKIVFQGKDGRAKKIAEASAALLALNFIEEVKSKLLVEAETVEVKAVEAETVEVEAVEVEAVEAEAIEVKAVEVKAVDNRGTPEKTLLSIRKPSDFPAPTARALSTSNRILRDTELVKQIKILHKYQCQLCGISIKLKDGKLYIEAHHIKPLGRPHNGPDIPENIICVCPNHHVELDFGAIKLNLQQINHVLGHIIDQDYVDYHNSTICEKP